MESKEYVKLQERPVNFVQVDVAVDMLEKECQDICKYRTCKQICGAK
jgi:hypothetical protein